VGRFEKDVAGVVDGLRIARRNEDRRGPLKADAQIFAAVAGGIERVDADVAGLARAMVVAGDDPTVFAGVDDIWVGGIGGGVAGFAAADFVPAPVADAGGGRAVARTRRGAEILHGARHVKRQVIVHGDVIELGQRQRRSEPGLAAVHRDIDTAV